MDFLLAFWHQRRYSSFVSLTGDIHTLMLIRQQEGQWTMLKDNGQTSGFVRLPK
jgi:hypothetical protein